MKAQKVITWLGYLMLVGAIGLTCWLGWSKRAADMEQNWSFLPAEEARRITWVCVVLSATACACGGGLVLRGIWLGFKQRAVSRRIDHAP